MTARVSDNPHKPGTEEHRAWEFLYIHTTREIDASARQQAFTAAHERLAALKSAWVPVDTSVDELVEAMAHVDDPEPDSFPIYLTSWDASVFTTVVTPRDDDDGPLHVTWDARTEPYQSARERAMRDRVRRKQ